MQGVTVLYVEDEADDALFMQLAFRKAGAEEVLRSIDDGGKAIAYLKGEVPYADRTLHPLPSLILLDLNLPILSGFDVLAWIRSQEEWKRIPVIVFSSSGRQEDRDRAKEQGADHYVLKPMSVLSFVELARQIVNVWLPGGRPAEALIQ